MILLWRLPHISCMLGQLGLLTQCHIQQIEVLHAIDVCCFTLSAQGSLWANQGIAGSSLRALTEWQRAMGGHKGAGFWR